MHSKETIRQINAAGLMPPRGKYSHVTIAHGTAYISGQLPVNSEGEPVTSESFAVQAKQTLSNLDACLASAGLERTSLVQVRVYLTDMSNWKEFDEIYGEWIGSHRPARAVAGVNALNHAAALEMEATAVVD
ncbi:enamine deaminase RidA [Arthrobacter sp. Soil782]|uniref:RidA family protein n=1 Tax=Arthrobacter sp. Soil782 TaxID=1736410 RepID=UPI00070134E9|nr:RidA family protein [Arthrobacter sp. Soil782]KRF09467.1 enamine deaminase RidA [Arthrobacter sp. Soil782]